MNIVFMGTEVFSVTVAKTLHQYFPIQLIVTQPSKQKGRKKTLIAPPLKTFAEEENIPVIQPKKIKASTQEIMAYNPDIIITAAYGQILPKSLLEAPTYGAINVHGSLLPKYRGGAPIQRAIENGETYTGISIMYMAEKMDAGDIIATKRLAIEKDDTALSMFEKLAELGADLLVEVMPDIIAGNINPTKQDIDKVTFAPNIKREEEKLDFTLDAITLERKIRAFYPSPSTYFLIDNQPIKVLKASVYTLDEPKDESMISTVSDHDKDGVVIQTAKGKLRLDQVQPAGKKPMDGKSFLNGKGKTLLPIGQKIKK